MNIAIHTSSDYHLFLEHRNSLGVVGVWVSPKSLTLYVVLRVSTRIILERVLSVPSIDGTIVNATLFFSHMNTISKKIPYNYYMARSIIFLVIILVSLTGCKKRRSASKKRFVAPNKHVQKKILGNSSINELVRVFKVTKQFPALQKPGPSDWLAEHKEAGQTFEQYKYSGFNQVDKKRDTLVILPLGTFPKESSPSLKVLKRFMEAYFMLKVTILDPINPPKWIKRRKNPNDGHLQLHAGDILSSLINKLPDEAYALIGITMTDLYPKVSWNFVFGMAMLRKRVGVFSFARYTAAFNGVKKSKENDLKMLRRSMQVLSHETAHMFGMKHCIYYACNVNGSNNQEESDRTPMHLCPVCLMKLWSNVKFSPVERYKKLLKVYTDNGLKKESTWIQSRLDFIKP